MSQDQASASPPRNRSVNDFDTPQALKSALRHGGFKAGGFHDVGRDFPGSAPPPDKDDDSVVSEQSNCSILEPLTGADLDWVITNLNAEISQTQSLEEELKRLQVLRSYLLLDSQKEPSFERLTALASRMFRVPIALVSLVDLGRQWFMSNRGLGDVRETPRKLAFCAHCILSKEDLLIVPDATTDPRFMDNPIVTGPPHIRFYAGAPLLCPEGYKLGTLCIIDMKTRHEGLSMEEKQNLRELAELVVDAMVQRRKEKLQVLQDKSQIIACTAHDLLTPLSGVQMSLSLLLEDDSLQERLTDNQKELIATAGSCSEVMNRICQHAIDTFRDDVAKQHQQNEVASKNDVGGPKEVLIDDMVKKLELVMEPYPKMVPVSVVVDDSVPPVIIADDLKIFRSAINYLTNACAKTTHGFVKLHIYVTGKRKKQKIVFECIDSGPGVPLEMYQYLFRPFREDDQFQLNDSCVSLDKDGSLMAAPATRPAMSNSGLGLYSVAVQISSIGGEYGFRPREQIVKTDDTSAMSMDFLDEDISGAVFWFSIPLVTPENSKESPPRPANRKKVTFGTVSTDRSIEFDFSSLQRNGSAPIADPFIEKAEARQGTSALLQQAESLAEKIQRMATDSPDSTAEETSEIASAADNATATTTRTRRALVIDDSVVIRKSMHRALTKLGFDVSLATNGLEGVNEMQLTMFDLVLCDFLMPVMDGLDCVQQYRGWEKIHRPWFSQYICGISAHAGSQDVEKGKSAGMNDFKSKPVTLKMLKELETSNELKEIGDKLDQIEEETKGKYAAVVDIDMIEENGHDDKRLKLVNGSEDFSATTSSTNRPMCLVGEDSLQIGQIMCNTIERRGWRAVVVRDGEDALRLLKTRNWTAVFLDENLPRLTGVRVVERFREWERENRVARQKNVYMLTDSCAPSLSRGIKMNSWKHPSGFDTVLPKPVLEKDLEELIDVTAIRISGETALSGDILPR